MFLGPDGFGVLGGERDSHRFYVSGFKAEMLAGVSVPLRGMQQDCAAFKMN